MRFSGHKREIALLDIPLRYFDKDVMITKLERKNTVAQVVPVDDDLATPKAGNEPHKGEGRDARWVLSFA